MQILTKHKLIVDLFANWKRAYNDISASGEVTKIIQKPQAGLVDKTKHDLVVPHDAVVNLDPAKKRGVELGSSVSVPVVKARATKNHNVAIKINLSTSEARLITSYYGISGDLQDSATRTELATSIKEDLLKKAQKSGK